VREGEAKQREHDKRIANLKRFAIGARLRSIAIAKEGDRRPTPSARPTERAR